MKLTAPTVVLALAIAAPLGSAILYAESHYFKVSAAQELRQEIQAGRLDRLYEQLREFIKESQRRPLTDIEMKHMDRVQKEVDRLEKELKK